MNEQEILDRAKRAAISVDGPDQPYDALLRRLDRKRRNQRIAAGVVGFAVFVPAIWIVTTGGVFDRTQTPAVPGTAASAAPDVVRKSTCSDGARWRLEVTDTGDRIKVRFEVHRSPVGHRWRIHFRYKSHNIATVYGHVFFRDTRVASDSGVLVVQLTRPDWDRERPVGPDGVDGGAVDKQTGEVCKASAWYR